jgi:hypothetical protein
MAAALPDIAGDQHGAVGVGCRYWTQQRHGCRGSWGAAHDADGQPDSGPGGGFQRLGEFGRVVKLEQHDLIGGGRAVQLHPEVVIEAVQASAKVHGRRLDQRQGGEANQHALSKPRGIGVLALGHVCGRVPVPRQYSNGAPRRCVT